jgi:PAS domain S-box-containing protein
MADDLFDAVPDGLVLIDPAGRIALLNRRAAEMLGYPPGELVGQSLGTILPDDPTVTVAAERPVERIACRAGGTAFPAEVTAGRPDDAGRVILALRDITDRKREEDRRLSEERRRERQMVRAEQMAAIGQVAAGVAHELRNPLTSVKGLVQVNLRDAAARGLPAEDLRVIEQEVRRMERTLQTFLDFARPPRPDRRRLDLADVVARVLALVGGRAKKQRVTLGFAHPPGPAEVDGDQDQLQQLVLNLVLNALDAMPRGGTIQLDLAARDGAVELVVRDTGPGIAAHILPKVFETFVSSKETGVGLGLPVSQRIAEEHGGSLTAYNQASGGACFTLRLPTPA